MNLAWKLAGVLAGALPATVLDTYQTERKPHARAMIRLAKLIGMAMTRGRQAGQPHPPPYRAARLRLIPGVTRSSS